MNDRLDKDAHIKKLERRIHNQRAQLRINWMILEQRQLDRSHWIKPRYLKKCLEQARKIRELERMNR